MSKDYKRWFYPPSHRNNFFEKALLVSLAVLALLLICFVCDLIFDIVMSWIRDTDHVQSQRYLNAVQSVQSSPPQPNNAWIGAAIGAAGSLLGSIFGSASQNSANRANLAFAREQMQNNNEQAAINRDWQYMMQEKQNRWSADMWQKTFDAENAYNSAAAQMSRLQQAGINPFVAANDVARVSSTSSLAPPAAGVSPSGATASSSLSANQLPANPLGNLFSNIGSLASAYVAIAQAKKAGADTKAIESTLDAKIKQANADATFADVQAKLQQEFGYKMKKQEFNKLVAEIHDIWSSQAFKENNIELLHNQTYESLQRGLKGKAERETYERMADYIVDTARATMEKEQEAVNTQKAMTATEGAKQQNLRAGASASLATAQNQIAQANSTRELLAGAKRLQSSQEFGNNVQSLNALYDLYSKIQTFPDEWKRKHYEALKVFKEVDWYDTDKTVDNVTKIMNMFFKGLDSVSGFIPFAGN